MAAAAPVEVGTRGTVASLVMKEIEYFRRLELERHGSCRKPQPQPQPQNRKVEATSGGSSSSTPNRPAGFGFLIMATLRKKKRRGGGGFFLPSMCSAAEVADCHRLNGIPGFSYRILKDDLKDSCDT